MAAVSPDEVRLGYGYRSDQGFPQDTFYTVEVLGVDLVGWYVSVVAL